jgi:hypothetical protein
MPAKSQTKSVKKVSKPVAPRTKKVAPAAKKSVTPKAVAAPVKAPKTMKPTSEEIFKAIEFEAYILAEKDGFTKDPAWYWMKAETDVKDRLGI